MIRGRILLGLWLAVLVSALAVVYTSHLCRLLYSELAQLQQVENNLQVNWGQYLLEQSSLASLTRIEKEALSELGMRVPDIKEVVMVQP
jgi:cell division protein FtsL